MIPGTPLPTPALATSAALRLIRWYQRAVSPHKGFRCAHGQYFGGPSCSGVIARIVAERGTLGGWPEIRAQFAACRVAAALLAGQKPEQRKEKEGCDCDFLDPDCAEVGCCVRDLACDLGSTGGSRRVRSRGRKRRRRCSVDTAFCCGPLALNFP